MKRGYIILIVFLFLINPISVSASEQLKSPAKSLHVISFGSPSEAEYNRRPDLVSFFADADQARKNLFIWLEKRPHSETRNLPCFISAKPEAIYNFSVPQLIRVYLILFDLENNRLLEQIGKIMENYDENQYYEPAGLAILKDGHIFLDQRPSRREQPIPDTQGAFFYSSEDLLRPNVFLFHAHPYNQGRLLPGPSLKLEFGDQNRINLDFDIGFALNLAERQGESHDLLISQRGGRMVNLIYYAAEATAEPINKFSLCDKLKNFRIIDLGNWQY